MPAGEGRSYHECPAAFWSNLNLHKKKQCPPIIKIGGHFATVSVVILLCIAVSQIRYFSQ